MIVLEEEYGDTVYFVKKGTIKISRLNDEGKEVILALLGNGEIFGELSALDGEARSANAYAQENCVVYSINSSDFIHVLKTNFKITHCLLGELAKRIRKSDKQIEALSLSKTLHIKFSRVMIDLCKKSLNSRSSINSIPKTSLPAFR